MENRTDFSLFLSPTEFILSAIIHPTLYSHGELPNRTPLVKKERVYFALHYPLRMRYPFWRKN